MLVLFFLAGLAWVYHTFATKCLMDATLKSQKIYIDDQNASTTLADLRIEIDNLENLQTVAKLKGVQAQHLKELKDRYQKKAEENSNSLAKLTAAFDKCTVY